MKYTSAILLAAAAGQASAGAISHRHAGKYHNHALRHAEILHETHPDGLGKRSVLSTIMSKGAQPGANAGVPTSNAWIGSQGPYTNTFTNAAAEDAVLFCWGPAGSWINAVPPLISEPIAAGQSVTVSYAEGASGACAPVFADTSMVNGQLYQTWLEYTFAGVWSTYDVSREVNMNGRTISTVHKIDGNFNGSSNGCLTDMNTCVFKCSDPTAASCWYGYQLENCGASNGGGSGVDPTTGGASGGCNGISNGRATLATTFS